jgi:hypothetical protein
MDSDRLMEAIARRDLTQRVALRLAAGRSLLDNELASALGVSPGLARELLRGAIDEVAEEVGASSNDTWVALRALTPADWRETARLARAEEAPAAPAAVPDPSPEPAPAPARGPRRRAPMAILVVAALSVVAIVVALLLAGSSEQNRPAGAGVPTRAGGPTARLTGPRTLRIDLAPDDLPRGGTYEAWAFDSLIDARPLGLLRPGRTTLRIPAGVQVTRFRFLDVSRQPAGQTRTHSGESLLRGPAGALRGGRAVRLRPLTAPE